MNAFAARWLQLSGAPPERLSTLVATARARARRFPQPVAFAYPLLLWLVEWLAPLLLLGRAGRASRLPAAQLQQLMERSHGSRHAVLRLTTLVVLSPLMEALTEEAPPRKDTHPLAPYLERSAAQPPAAEEFDVVVIGSGAGGAPLAWQLAAAGRRVLVLERGGLVTADTAPRTVERHMVEQGMVGSMRGSPTLVLAGTSLGGTTSINSGTSLRPLPDCVAAWDDACGTHLGTELDRYLERASVEIGVTVPPRHLLSASARLMDDGLRALGRPDAYVLPRNAPRCEGSGRCCFGCPAGAKQSTDRAFLPRTVALGGTLLAGTTARRIREEGRWVHVEVDTPHGRRHLRARHLVIAAGALFTPGLLRRNRLGRRWRHAGRHLKIHPATKVLAHFPGLAHGPGGVPQGLGYRPPELPRLTFEGIHTPRSVVAPLICASGERFTWWLDHLDDLASFGLMARDRAVGAVYDAGGRPIVNYRPDERDVREVLAGLKLIAESFFAAGAERVLLPLAGGGNELCSRGDAAAFDPNAVPMGAVSLSGFHPQGTAGIGRVVDGDLRLLGSRRISVCDASVLPDSPGVNPQLTIMALSLRLADRLLSQPA